MFNNVKKTLKKIGVFVLAGAMMIGTATHVFAGWVTERSKVTLFNTAEIEYMLRCDFITGEAEAQTIITSPYDAIELGASVELEMEVMTSTGLAEYTDRDYESHKVYSGTYADATVELATPSTGYYIEMYAASTHRAEFYDGIDVGSDTEYLSITLD